MVKIDFTKNEAVSCNSASQGQDPRDWKQWNWLAGEWKGEGSGEPLYRRRQHPGKIIRSSPPRFFILFALPGFNQFEGFKITWCGYPDQIESCRHRF